MQIGDKVRFLDEVGGGRVTRFQSKMIAMVEDADGFEVPMPVNKLVVVEQAVKEDSPNTTHGDDAPTTNTVSTNTETEVPTGLERLKQVLHTTAKETTPSVKKIDLQHGAYGRSVHSSVRRGTPIVVDLHAHEVLETTAGMSNGDILRYQLRIMRDTLEQHKNNRGQKIVFIHGKGQGVLRQAVVNELRHYYPHLPYQDASFSEYGYGATQVTMK